MFKISLYRICFQVSSVINHAQTHQVLFNHVSLFLYQLVQNGTLLELWFLLSAGLLLLLSWEQPWISLNRVSACALLLSRVWFFATPWTVAHQAPQSMEFSRQEYQSGLPFSPPGDLLNPGIFSIEGPNPCLLYFYWRILHHCTT